MTHRLSEGIVPLRVVLLRPHLDNVFSFGPQHSKDIVKLEGAWGGPPWWQGWNTCPVRRGCGNWPSSA